MALGSTQPLTERVPGVFPGDKGRRCVRLTTLPPSCAVVMKSGNLNFLEPSGPLQACKGIGLPFPYIYYMAKFRGSFWTAVILDYNCLIKHHSMMMYRVQGCNSIISWNFDTRCTKWLLSRAGHLNPTKFAPRCSRLKGWLGPSADFDAVAYEAAWIGALLPILGKNLLAAS
jgi:hypothetical protein